MLSFQHVLKALLGHGVGELDFKLPEAFIDSRAMSEGGLSSRCAGNVRMGTST